MKDKLMDKRVETLDQSVWWLQLSLAQKFSANTLGQFGCQLQFIRKEKGRSLAVLTCNTDIATVNEDGEINSTPNITLR